jgi:hypothetical protein
MSFQSKGIGEVLADKVSEATKPFKESTPAEEFKMVPRRLLTAFLMLLKM